MRRLTLVLLLCLALTALVAGAPAPNTFEVITVAATAIGLADSTISPPGEAQMKVCVGRLETAEIRWRTDGGTPTSSVGTPLEPLEILTLSSHDDMVRLRMIRTTGTSGSITWECR